MNRRLWSAAGGGAVLVVAAVVVGLGSTGGPSAPPPLPARPAPAGIGFGVNVNFVFNNLTYSQAQIDAQLRAVRATGSTVARSDALWGAGEPRAPVDGRPTFDWEFDDQVAGSLAIHGLTWLPILDYSAPWAESLPGQDHSPPRSDAAFAAWAAAFAARYGPGGGFWAAHPGLTPAPVQTIEVWNEPDNPQFWAPAPNPAAYAALYLATRAAIDRVDPDARVIVGGLTDAQTFLPALLRDDAALRGHVDGVAIHPYGTPETMMAKVAAARSTLVGLGMGTVPLYVTEFGWTTDPPGALDYLAANRRPDAIEAALTALRGSGCGVAAAVLYTWVTPERDRSDAQDWYGIANPADPGDPTPDTAALTAGLRGAAGGAGGGGGC